MNGKRGLLTHASAAAKTDGDMQLRLPLLALVAAAALAGCDNQPETIEAGGPYDPNANLSANSGPVELPPAIVASHPYRCKDNSLIYIDWMSDNSARVKANRNEVGTTVPLGEGSPLTGDATTETINYNGKSCSR